MMTSSVMANEVFKFRISSSDPDAVGQWALPQPLIAHISIGEWQDFRRKMHSAVRECRSARQSVRCSSFFSITSGMLMMTIGYSMVDTGTIFIPLIMCALFIFLGLRTAHRRISIVEAQFASTAVSLCRDVSAIVPTLAFHYSRSMITISIKEANAASILAQLAARNFEEFEDIPSAQATIVETSPDNSVPRERSPLLSSVAAITTSRYSGGSPEAIIDVDGPYTDQLSSLDVPLAAAVALEENSPSSVVAVHATPNERLAHLESIREMISEEQYEEKKQEIVDSI